MQVHFAVRSQTFAICAMSLVVVAASYLPASWSQSGGFTTPPSLGTQLAPQSSISVVGPSNVAATQSHLMSSATLSNGAQQIVIVDPSRLTMAVYHIDPSKGDAQLKSVRKLDADFSLEEFNLSEPTPSTIRKNLRGSDR